jgi:hypothetical protein
MRKSITKPRRKKAPKRVLALPDLEQSKAAVLNSLTSASGQRTYDYAIGSSSRGIARSRASHSTAQSCFAAGFTSNGDTTLQPITRCSRYSSGADFDEGNCWRCSSDGFSNVRNIG